MFPFAGGLGLVLMIVGAGVAVWLARRSPTPSVTEEGRRLVADVPVTPQTRALLVRWRQRATFARRSFAVPAAVGAAAAGLVLRQELAVGVGAHPAWSDPLLAGMVAAFLGAIVAEVHHLRPTAGGPRSAQLRPRDLAPMLPPYSRVRLGLLAVLAASSSLAAATATDVRVPWLGVSALALAALVPLIQRGIALRRQPPGPAPLRAADVAVRHLAVRSVDRAGAGAILLLAAWQLAPVYGSVTLRPLQTLLALGQVASVVVAVLWWRRSSPRRLVPAAAPPLDPGAPAATSPGDRS